MILFRLSLPSFNVSDSSVAEPESTEALGVRERGGGGGGGGRKRDKRRK